MVTMTINGVEYGLRFDLEAIEQAEEVFGSLKDMQNAVASGSAKAAKQAFVILANCQRDYEGKPMDVTEAALKHAPVATFRAVAAAIKSAMDEGMRVETTNGGEADDNVHDGYLEQIERKNG